MILELSEPYFIFLSCIFLFWFRQQKNAGQKNMDRYGFELNFIILQSAIRNRQSKSVVDFNPFSGHYR